MDRRMILAAALMMVILAVYQIFAPPPRPRVPTGTVADTAAVAAEPGGGGSLQSPPQHEGVRLGGGSPPDASEIGASSQEVDLATSASTTSDTLMWGEPEAKPSDVHVETSLFAATFNTRGARVTSWKLKHFGGPNGEPWVELVPPDSEGALTLRIETAQGKIDFSRVKFRALTGDLHLSETSPTGTLAFEAPGPDGVVVRQVYTFSEGSYSFGADVQVTDGTGRAYVGNEHIAFQWMPGLELTEQDVDSELQQVGVVAGLPDRVFRANLRNFKEPTDLESHARGNWGALHNKYFSLLTIPPRPGTLELGFSGNVQRAQVSMISGLTQPLGELSGPAGPPEAPFHAGDLEIYLGPLEHKVLMSYGRGAEEAVNLGWRWLRPLSRATHWVLAQTHRVIPNWGWAIIVLAIISKLIFHPLTHHSVKSMRAMQRIQPQLAEIREKYKKDPQRQQREMMKLYKDAGVNPMGGCLPLLIQSPVFMALYNVLQHAIELRQAPFMMWIDDLSAQDALFMIPFSLPFLGHAFNLLPILMGVGQYYQQKTSMPTGAAADPRTQMMGYIMPPMLTIMFYRLPSGLVLYWIVNTLLSILHQHYMNRGESTAGGTPPPPPGKRRRGRRGAVTGNGGGVASEPAVTAGKSSSEE